MKAELESCALLLIIIPVVILSMESPIPEFSVIILSLMSKFVEFIIVIDFDDSPFTIKLPRT